MCDVLLLAKRQVYCQYIQSVYWILKTPAGKIKIILIDVSNDVSCTIYYIPHVLPEVGFQC